MPKKNKNSTIHYAGRPYTQIPDGLWVCPEFNALKPTTRCVYLVMLSKWNPFQPDADFTITYTEFKEITGFASDTIRRAITKLMVEGFIEIPKRGGYPHNVSLYKLNPKWIEKTYPKNNKTLPGYMREFNDTNDG